MNNTAQCFLRLIVKAHKASLYKLSLCSVVTMVFIFALKERDRSSFHTARFRVHAFVGLQDHSLK